jgi:sugar O-acyltransferase (sialic acid O-acetyltransferase NeuD family)
MSEKKRLVIFGAGGLGRELKTWIEKSDQYYLIGFFDDTIPTDTIVDGLRVLGGIEAISRYNTGELNVVIAIGNPSSRAGLIEELRKIPNLLHPVLIHPRAIIDDTKTVRLGKGTIITAGCALTTNITIGEHTLINLNSTIGHDCVIGEGCCIMPGVNLSGNLIIGDHVLIGTGACVLNNIKIGDRAKVGAGAVVTRTVPADCTAIGVPAKPIRA